jgi:hypothetical protein
MTPVSSATSSPFLLVLVTLRRGTFLHTNTHAARTRTGAHEIDRRPGAQSSVTSNAATQ